MLEQLGAALVGEIIVGLLTGVFMLWVRAGYIDGEPPNEENQEKTNVDA